ncbi:phage baseplate assembly protein V [Dechloromonas denitrificans]|uniref:phage baseplate assembly protein V n=1 Tax=Dechloromonas denitrificans TaxID=281362 RepID=UPI001CF8255A|nr:phage baseplate assembly protein V [Dechloromonas denitrificans]UCV01995.1 hypothetical protein KI611_12850 [Dechloromonas denitrificans]UCV06328.1 hypothetical protein KI615_12920 [Dechloromonas denitrificans]
MAPVAGSNWGSHLTPRPGQEVVVAFQNGNIDRPVIVGSVYNGQGSADAPAFFAGQDAAPHTHGASLFGLKSRMLKGLGAISMHNVRGLFLRLEFPSFDDPIAR